MIKNFKKGIDKPNALCYNSQAAYGTVGGRVIENWTTRDKYKAKKQVRISSKVLKKTTLNKVKEKAKN